MGAVEYFDVSARDGLQNDSVLLSTAQKLELIHLAIAAKCRRIEVTSFVHPKRVPQMADAEDLIAQLPDRDDLTFIGLVMNDRGLDRALATKIDEIGCVTVASDTFAQKNQGQTSQESVDVAAQLIARAKREGRSANVTISAAFGCPFEGEVAVERVVEMARQLADAEPREIAIADTIGVGDPAKTLALVEGVRAVTGDLPLRAHFHNTRNTAIANAYIAASAGVTTLDGSMGGIGGCPFAPNAPGTVPSEDLVYMLERAGIDTGIDLDGLLEGAAWLSEALGKSLPGMVSRAGPFPKSEQNTEQNIDSNPKELETT